MKINKIVCDICNKEIDIETNASEGLAIFEFIKVQTKVNFMLKAKPEKDVAKTSLDLCSSCAQEAEDYLFKKRDEKQKATKEKVENNE